jgi:hypothetical protein
MRLPARIGCIAVMLVTLQLTASALAADKPRRHHADGAGAAVPATPEFGRSRIANPSHVVNEGTGKRRLWIDTGRVADFRRGGAGRPVIRAAEPGELSEGNRSGRPDQKTAVATPDSTSAASGAGAPGAPGTPGATGAASAGNAQVSPIFVDASGRPRALPGGVIVSLKQALPPAQARDRLQAAGLNPLRQIGERMWLVDSPVGIASLDLAGRLHADGLFEFVQPNWWHARTTK